MREMKMRAIAVLLLLTVPMFSSCASAKKLYKWKQRVAPMITPVSLGGNEKAINRERKEEIRTERRLIRNIDKAERSWERANKPKRSRMTAEARKRIRELKEQQREQAKERRKQITRKQLREKAKSAIERQKVYQIQGENH